MRVIIAGGRDFNDYELLKTEVNSLIREESHVIIVSGQARGADRLGERYAEEQGLL